VPEEYPTIITEEVPSHENISNQRLAIIRESIHSVQSIPDEYTYSEFSQHLEDGNPQRSFHSRQQDAGDRQRDEEVVSDEQNNPKQMTQEEYFQMKKEQIEVIYQGNEIIYEEPDVEHRDGISTIQSQHSQSRNYNRVQISYQDESSCYTKHQGTENSSPSNVGTRQAEEINSSLYQKQIKTASDDKPESNNDIKGSSNRTSSLTGTNPLPQGTE
jgi:hypothetical protein